MVGCGRCLGGDAGEALDIFVEGKTAIEAPLKAGGITLGVLRVERATSAGDRALDVAETRSEVSQEGITDGSSSGFRPSG